MNTEFKEQALEAPSVSSLSRGPATALGGRTHHCGHARTQALTEGGRQGQGTSELHTYKSRQCAVLVFAHSLLPEGTRGLMLFFSPSWKICPLGIQRVIKQTTGMLHTAN